MNKELNYTKEEWAFERDRFNVESDEGNKLCIGSITAGDDSWVIARIENAAECEANAQLISSAPDCYEGLKDALKEICRMCVRLNPQHENCTSCEEMERSRLPLLKAEGK